MQWKKRKAENLKWLHGVSGKFHCEGTQISYSSTHYLPWTVDVRELRLVGEYTTPDGPGIDDYFFVFFEQGSDDWLRASFYAEGREELFPFLHSHMEDELQCGLVNSTDYKSRVLWPAPDEDPPLFDFIDVQHQGRFSNLKDWVFGPWGVRFSLRPEFRVESGIAGDAQPGSP